MTWVFCWWGEQALEVSSGTRCPNCGSTQHQEVPNDGLCRAYARCHDLNHGHPCELPVDHEDRAGHASHACPAASDKCEIVISKILRASL